MVIYYGGFLSITVGAINNKYVGYPTADGTCNKTYKKIDSISITPKTFTVKVVATDDGNKYTIDGNLTNDITLFRNSTYTFDLNDASVTDYPLLVGTSEHNPYIYASQGINFYLNGDQVSYMQYKDASNFTANGVIGSSACTLANPCSGDRKLTFTVADDAPSELVIFTSATGLATRIIKIDNF